MTDELTKTTPASEPHSENKAGVSPSPAATARIAEPLDRWSIRRAELKKQKRRAHRRRINAANTSG